MALKVLPPTLRKNNRYLTVEIKSMCPFNKDDFVSIVWDACIRFQGENNTSNFNLWVMRFYDSKESDDYYNYKAIIRCQRDYVEEVRRILGTEAKVIYGADPEPFVSLAPSVDKLKKDTGWRPVVSFEETVRKIDG